jgi:hypothetical protein
MPLPWLVLPVLPPPLEDELEEELLELEEEPLGTGTSTGKEIEKNTLAEEFTPP